MMSDVEPTPTGWKVSILLSAEHARRLAVLAGGESGPAGAAAVLAVLADHAQQGVYRPGAWERDWVMQVFGDEWLTRVEPDPDGLSADGRVIFDRPRPPS
jgi:hypothetical protein